MMLKRIYLAIAGCTNKYPDGRLIRNGAMETVEIAIALHKTGDVPKVIFTDGEFSAIQSAYIMAGMLGICRIVNDKRLEKSDKEKETFRNNFLTPQVAHMFLSEVYSLNSKDESVVFMTDRCWGLTFGGTWPRSSLQCFDLKNQKLEFVAYYGPSI